ncbi:Exportin 1-like protein [Popillia japonica]|uniref:Exportin 1-like protein n=1 Tax=Popillia japonica TaxID=7064 RepID=A0AAW1N485_POPJA
MTHTEYDTLVALEHLMDEFYVRNISNGRKHEIETQLNNFSNQKDAWKFCVYFITNTSSQYVSMYALSTIESVINRQWYSLEWDNRTQLKSTLYNFYVEQDNTTSNFIRNKLAKLIVDIARYDWPQFYPEFFSNILQLLKSDRLQLLGLILLRTTSEELMNPRPDLNSYRKEELTRLLQQYIPQVFQILISILDNLGNKPRHKATATPPPSPTHPSSQPNLAQQISAASFRTDPKAIIREGLATVQHLLSWSQLNQVPVQIISAIFNFTHVSSYAQDDDDMCLLAMSTLNEILYRKCVPPGSQPLFIQLYHNTVQLMKDIACSSSGRIETLSSDFMEKLSELLCLLMEQHLWRLEAEPGFSALEFLSLLFELTIRLPSLPCYLRCLAVWAAFIKQIKPQNAHRYSEALQSLIPAVLNKMQFTCNYFQLSSINDEDLDEDNETEWQLFLKTSIELIAMVAEFAPHETFNQILIPWKKSNDVYCMLQNAVNHVSLTLKLEYSETQRLHCILRDLSSLTQALARLSTLFIEQGQGYTKLSASSIDNLIIQMIESASIAKHIKYYHLKLDDSRLVDDFTEVQSQLVAALKTWCTWLFLNGERNNRYLKDLIEISLRHLQSAHEEPPKVCHAAAHLFLTVSSAVFPPSLITLPSVVDYIQLAPKIKYYSRETHQVVISACCNILVRPWGELSQLDSQKRNIWITSFFDLLTRDFRDLMQNGDFRDLMQNGDVNKMKDIVTNTLPILSNVIDYCKNYPSSSKKLLYMGLKSCIDHGLLLFPTYSRYEEISDNILTFFLNVLGVLQQQMGIDATKHAVEVFLQVAVSEQQSKNLSSLDKLLQILQLIVEAPGNSYKSFLPGILQLCLQNVYPVLICQANKQPDVIIALLRLLYSMLLYRWNYFYISQVRLGHSPGCSDTLQGPDNPQQPEQLLAVLRVFGQSLLQPDINIFKTSLNSLEDLNSKWKLYHKALFQDQLLSQFLTVLIQTLLDKTHNLLTEDILQAIYNLAAVNFSIFFSTFLHNLLTEDILQAIYNLAAVNFSIFFSTFLPNFLRNTDCLTQEQYESLQQNFKKDTDMPTFVQNLQRFVNDVSCYRTCNSSLPSGNIF